MPAVAVFVKGKLVHAESLYIAPGKCLPYRLYRLLICMKEVIIKWKPDVAAIEWIPQKINGSAIPALRSAIGVISALFGHTPDRFIEVPAMAWQHVVKKEARDEYIKSDIADAIGIGLWVLRAADIQGVDIKGAYQELNAKLAEIHPVPEKQGFLPVSDRIKAKRHIIAQVTFEGGVDREELESEEVTFLDD